MLLRRPCRLEAMMAEDVSGWIPLGSEAGLSCVALLIMTVVLVAEAGISASVLLDEGMVTADICSSSSKSSSEALRDLQRSNSWRCRVCCTHSRSALINSELISTRIKSENPSLMVIKHWAEMISFANENTCSTSAEHEHMDAYRRNCGNNIGIICHTSSTSSG